MLLAIIISLMLPIKSLSNQQCTNYARITPRYHLSEKCHRSKLGIVAFANYTSLSSCQRLGTEKRGLAINYSPIEARDNDTGYSCQVLKCAEADLGLSLENDTSYDYYTLYAKPLPHVNSTCVPTIGMFYLLPRLLNYTEAVQHCSNMSGSLADVSTDQRTDSLAQLLAGASVNAAFIGLRRSNSSIFESSRGDTLDCTTYRAWAPGHPRRNFTKYDCVLISRRKVWVSTACSKRYPSLCELSPGGPYKRSAFFASRKINETTKTTPDQ